MTKPNEGLYVARLDLRAPNHAGVSKKIDLQRQALEGYGFPSQILTMDGTAIRLGSDIIREKSQGFRAKIVAEIDFYEEMANVSGEFDWIYIRHQRASPFLNHCLKKIRRARPDTPILVEFPTWPLDGEAQGLRGKLLMISDRVWRPKMAQVADHLITFSKHQEILKKNTIKIDNGFDIEGYTAKGKQLSDPIRLIGLANVSRWHGYDRVIEGLYRHSVQGRQDVHLDIVGTGAELASLKALVQKRGLSNLVKFHGNLTGAPLDSILDECHLGIGSLGMHRIGVMYGSTLKAREFCARGLPFVIGYEDPDFPPSLPFVHLVSAEEEPIAIDALVHFVNELVSEVPDYFSKMSAYAKQNLTWTQKMRPVVEALRSHSHHRSTAS